jgi:signal transduction histidine kinase
MRFMDRLSSFVAICLAAAAVAMAWRERVLRQRLARGTRDDREERAAVTRMMRLVAGDMRGFALSLLDHAQTSGGSDAAISGTARRLLTLSDDVLSQTDAPDGPPRLQESRFLLMPVLEFAVAQVAAQLGPAGRAWRIGPELNDVSLIADQRALNQILVLVLSSAAASTRAGDWIEITGALQENALLEKDWALTVQDEGIGLPMLQGDCEAHEARGVGFGLALARNLMAAHDGTLKVETAARVGTRVRLAFPAARLCEADAKPP